MGRFKGGRRIDFDGKDQFFTKDSVAKHVVDVVNSKFPFSNYDTILEPSAGSGNILVHLPEDKRIGIDLEPNHEEVAECDFFDYKFPEGNTLVIGNPPFGRASTLAISFFNQCAAYSDTIAFIIPNTWRFSKVQNKLDPRFKLVHEETIQEFAFTKIGKSPGKRQYEDGSININCVLQIWTCKDNDMKNLRVSQPLPRTHEDFDAIGYFTNDKKLIEDGDDYDFLVKAWGGMPFAKKGPSQFCFGAVHDNAEGLKGNWRMQYTGIKAKNKDARKIFESIPMKEWWIQVSSMNTITPEILTHVYNKFKIKYYDRK